MMAQQTPHKHKPRIQTLDALRGIAAMTVVIAHCSGNLQYPSFIDKSPFYFFKAAHEAVVFFFILSGYVLVYQYKSKSHFNYLEFLTARVFRIYIPYIASIALSLILYYAGSNFIDGTFFGSLWSLPITQETVVNHLILISNFDTNQLNHVIWSLVHEMRLSILFPLILFAIHLKSNSSKAIFIVICIMSGILIGKGFLPSLGYLNSYIHTFYYFWLFVLGGLIVLNQNVLVHKYLRLSAKKKIILICAAIVFYSYSHTITYVLMKMPRLGLLNFSFIFEDFFTAIAASIFIVSAIAVAREKSFLEHPILLFFGKISYSLYLVHIPILAFIYKQFHADLAIHLILAIGVPIAILIAWLFNMIVERNSAKLGKSLSKKISSQSPSFTYPVSESTKISPK